MCLFLIVEDEPIVAWSLADALRDSGDFGACGNGR